MLGSVHLDERLHGRFCVLFELWERRENRSGCIREDFRMPLNLHYIRKSCDRPDRGKPLYCDPQYGGTYTDTRRGIMPRGRIRKGVRINENGGQFVISPDCLLHIFRYSTYRICSTSADLEMSGPHPYR